MYDVSPCCKSVYLRGLGRRISCGAGWRRGQPAQAHARSARSPPAALTGTAAASGSVRASSLQLYTDVKKN
ncbi:unnamed protein product [Colias eurytheme]|nr:unnamed protein product [Colias eurytheme]